MGLTDLVKTLGLVILSSAIASYEGRETQQRLWPTSATFKFSASGDK